MYPTTTMVLFLPIRTFVNFIVIKKPMDLGTMMRKLKGMIYNSKREFQADLNRIYNNCFTYNTDPSSTLRLHITLLKDKWTRLMAEVPEIEIKTIAVQSHVTESVDSSQSFSSLSSLVTTELDYSSLTASDVHLTLQTQTIKPMSIIPDRTTQKMGCYHKARLKATKRQRRKTNQDLFYPEVLFPFSIFLL